MSITAGGIGDKELLLIEYPLADCLRSFLIKELLKSVPAVSGRNRESRSFKKVVDALIFKTLCSDILEHLCASVLIIADLEQ